MFLMDGWYCFVIVELGSCLLSPLAVIACGCIVVIVFLDAYSTGHQLILNTQSGFDGPMIRYCLRLSSCRCFSVFFVTFWLILDWVFTHFFLVSIMIKIDWILLVLSLDFSSQRNHTWHDWIGLKNRLKLK